MDYEKNGGSLTAKSSALLLPRRRPKVSSGFVIGVISLFVFISCVTMVFTIDLAINILRVKSIYGYMHNRGSEDTNDASHLCAMPSSTYGCVPRHPYQRAPGYRQQFQDILLPNRRFIKKLRVAQKNETQPAQAG